MKVVLASANAKKLAELRRILASAVADLEVLGLDDVAPFDEPAETEFTFEGNALIKARACLAATGLPSLADDSGLCIDALNGMPGVLSARWSGAGDRANNDLVLSQMGDVPDERRTAQFRCAVALCAPGGIEMVEHGEMAGRILRAPQGAGGFGYDPLFVAADSAGQNADHTLSTAEISPEAKDAISHRGKALRTIAGRVASLDHDRTH